jgi:hypothetical protein
MKIRTMKKGMAVILKKKRMKDLPQPSLRERRSCRRRRRK